MSYHVGEGTETKLTFSASRPSTLLPNWMGNVPYLHTGVVFDNYDHYVET